MYNYLNSPKDAAEMRNKNTRISRDQAKIDKLIARLRNCQGDDAVVEWVGQFAALNDNSGLKYDKAAIAQSLIALGYTNNAHVGDPEVKTSRKIFAAWLVGQAIHCLQIDMPIHPAAEWLAKDYSSMTK